MKKQFTRLIGAFCVSIFLLLISTTGVLGQYCAIPAGSSDPTADYIANVTFAGINQSSGATTYTDYTNVVGAVTPGVTYPFSATPGNGGTWTETIVVYIDWDQSETFDPEERIEIGTCTGAGCASGISYDIEVPFSAVPGETRMRVIDNFSSYAIDPCNPFPGDFEYGEVEDYTIAVESGECTPPTVSYEITNNCEDETYSIVVTVSSLGTSSNATIFHKRSDGVLIGNTGINQFTVGEALPFGGNIPFGVTVRDSIVSGNPLCTLIRNLEEEICIAPNDEICNAISIACGDTVSQAYITGTPSENGACADGVTNDLWYTITVQEGLFYQVGFNGTSFNESSTAEVLVGDDCTGELTQFVDCTAGILSFYLDSAATYYIRAQPTTAAMDSIHITLQCYGAPENGDCASAIEVACEGTYEGVTTAAPQHDADQPFCGATAPSIFNTGIWYTYEADENINMNFSLSGSNYTTSLFLYTNSCEELVCVGGATTSLNASLSAGSTYYLYVTGTGNARGEFVLNTTCTPVDCPEYGNYGESCDDGDPSTVDDTITEDCDCIGRTPIAGEVCEGPGGPIAIDQLPYSTEDSTDLYVDDYTYIAADFPPLAPGAIISAGTPYFYMGGNDVVYSYTPAAAEVLNLSVSAHGTYAGLFVFTGCPFALTQGYSVSSSGTDSLKIEGLNAVAGETYYIVISTWPAPQLTPYKLDITKLNDCAGTPSAGVIDSEDMMVCAASAITLATTGASEQASGLTLIWQSSPAGEDEWTDIVGANAPTFVLEDGITVPTDFRYYAHCDNSNETDISNVLALTINPVITECYCVPSNPATTAYYISSVSTNGALQDLDRTSGFTAGGYADYTETDTLITHANQEFDVSIGLGGGYDAYIGVWVDLNQNGSFEDEGEKIISTTGYVYSLDVSVLIPELADGSYRMRVRSDYIYQVTPCGPMDYGESEDYVLKVITLNECAGTPEAGIVQEDSFSACANTAFSLSVVGATSPADGLERSWQSSPAGQDEWADIVDATSINYNVDGITEPTDFRYRVTCLNSQETVYSNSVQVGINPALDCYCIPSNPFSSLYYISSVSTDGALQDLDRTSGFTEGGYADYTETDTLITYANQEFDFSVGLGGGYDAYIGVWVDFNQNGSFDDAGEKIISTTGYVYSLDVSVLIPELADGSYRMRVRSDYIYQVTPCGAMDYGESEDYVIKVITLVGCSGTPTAGVAADSFDVCAGNLFTLTVEDATSPAEALERTWQSSPAGQDEWTDIVDAGSTSYNVVGGIVTPTDFRYRVTCLNSQETDYSNVVEVGLNPALDCYCIPTGAGNNTDEILNFSLANLDNTSAPSEGVAGYSDYSESVAPANLTPGESYIASLTSNTGSGNHGAAIWIDYDDNGIFDTDEKVTQLPNSIAGGATAYFPAFEVENVPGLHRLRVQYTYFVAGANLTPCSVTTTYSETEDYTVDIVQLDQCTGTPDAGTADMSEMDVCENVAFTLSVSGSSEVSDGLVRNWQSSVDNGDTWIDIAGATSTSYVHPGVSEPTMFRYSVTCTFSDESDVSNVISTSLNPASECYCIPTATNAARFVNNFSTTGANQNVTNLASGFSVGGYGDFTSMTVEQSVGGTVNFTTDISGGTAGFRIWVDWNQDGAFDITEEVAYASTAYASSQSGSFTVPANALPGMTRMRIVSHWLSGTGLVDPCITGFTYGEFEDYSFNVSASSSVSLNGTVTWNSNCGDRAATVKLYEPNTANMVASYDVTVASDGSYSIDDVATGTFDIIVKVSGYLAKGTEDVVIAGGVNNLASGAIIGGDIIDNNSINIADISALTLAYGTAPGDANYNPLANLDCAGGVAISDVSALTLNYGLAGDSAPLGN